MKRHGKLFSVAMACVMGLTLLSACSKQPAESTVPSDASETSEPQSTITSTPISSGSAEEMLDAISEASKTGKVLDCDFAAGNSTIDDFEEAWGTADVSDYVASAKGFYNTYRSRYIVVGFGKGDLVFDLRNTSPALSVITYDDVIAYFGKPNHTAKTAEGQIVLGYIVNDNYKLKFVFPNTDVSAKLDHYIVFYPAGTVNSMSGDPGREW